jgi:crossover junction endodeoxyribonuclease RuvC
MSVRDLFVGIDPGLNGAIGILNADGSLHSVEDMPTLFRGKGTVKREVDASGLAHLLRPLANEIRLVVVEKVGAMPQQGSASTFSLGHSYGTAVAVVAALGIPLQLSTPATWKRRMNLDRDKEHARATAIHWWPSAPLTRKKDADRAEALCLAKFAMQLP